MNRRRLLQGAWGFTLLQTLPACATPQGVTSAPEPAAPCFTRLVDLSQVVRGDVPYPPGEPLTQIDRDASGAVQSLRVGVRTGTTLRIVTPPELRGPTLEDLSPHDLLLPVRCLDLRDHAQDAADFRLSGAALVAWEQAHGRIEPGAAVLFATGWDLRWGDAAAYVNLDPQGQPTTPGLSAEAYAMLHERQVRALGFDTIVAETLGATRPWLLIENMTNLEQLPPSGATLLLGALKIQAAHAGPVRALALL